MHGHVLTLNAGSSSIKFALFDAAGDLTSPALVGQAEGLATAAPGRLRARAADGRVLLDAELPPVAHDAHWRALDAVLRWLGAQPGFAVRAVGHRVVHGGASFDRPVLLDEDALARMAALEPLAPLHQPHNLAGLRAASTAFPGVAQVACFDTAFHRTQPELNQRFALPQAWHDRGIRRYGFHGLSYESIRDQLASAEPVLARQRIVVAHLGNGASMCAMHEGRSVATTMSFSPLDGLPSGTRCGRIDAAVVLHLIEHEGLSVNEVSRLLARESGWLGLSGLTSDMRELLGSALPAAKLAVDHFVEQVLRELAGMAAALRGIDALVFTGGIGENAQALRARVLDGAAWLGLRAAPGESGAAAAQAPIGAIRRISAVDSRVQALVVHTNEESVIARHTAAIALRA